MKPPLQFFQLANIRPPLRPAVPRHGLGRLSFCKPYGHIFNNHIFMYAHLGVQVLFSVCFPSIISLFICLAINLSIHSFICKSLCKINTLLIRTYIYIYTYYDGHCIHPYIYSISSIYSFHIHHESILSCLINGHFRKLNWRYLQSIPTKYGLG